MTDGNQFQEQWLEEYDKEAGRYFDLAKTGEQQLADYGTQIGKIQEQATRLFMLFGIPSIGQFPFVTPEKKRYAEFATKAVTWATGVKGQISDTTDMLEKNLYYYNIYSVIPSVLATGTYGSLDEVLANYPIPASMAADERESVISAINEMITRTGTPPEGYLEAAAEGLELPPLVAPQPVAPHIPVGLHQLSTEEIVKALVTEPIPSPIMTQEQWGELFKGMGYADADLEAVEFNKAEAQRLADEWQEQTNMLHSFKSGLHEMPDYTLVSMMKEMAVQPGLAFLDTARIYFEHVSMPLAGLAYKGLIPDLEAEYQRFKKSENTWMALSHAWDAWDSNWFLKYMIMENVVDPLTYVGWGITGRVVKHVPLIGGKLFLANKAMGELLELPFDLLKTGWKTLPKTAVQRATLMQIVDSQNLERYLVKFTGKRLIHMTMSEIDDAVAASIKFTLAHPGSIDGPALAGKGLLKHAPMNVDDVASWSRILGGTVEPDNITRVTLMNTDDIFEDYFMRGMITEKEAAGRILRLLDVVDASEAKLKVAQQLIDGRATKIKTGATSFIKAASPYDAMRLEQRRALKISAQIEKAPANLARMQASRTSVLLHGIWDNTQSLWANYIDRWLVKPVAEAYLTFGMYGPMNVMEDYVRSALGGVMPRRMNVETWRRLKSGVITDPELERYGISEMTGYLLKEGADDKWFNPVLQLACGGNKKLANKLYTTLVRRPGALSMEVRRNFIGRRFQQIFREEGGDMVGALLKSTPKPPRLNAKLVKELESETYRMMTTGIPDNVRSLKQIFTHKKLTRAEVQNTMSMFPDMPPISREYIIKSYDRGTLFKDIDGTMKVASDILAEDFIKSPEYATAQIRALTDELTSLGVTNPQEMAQVIKAVEVLCDTYGALPHQVVAQATIRSRGLPLAERSAAFNREFDMIDKFLIDSGNNIDNLISKIKTDAIKYAPNDDYLAQTNRLLDIFTARKEYTAEFRAQNMVIRRETFESVSIKNRNQDFWDDFYQKMDTDWGVFEIKDASLYGAQVQTMELIDRSAGIKIPPRDPINVTGRALAPNDVATLIGCRGDDISKALLEVLAVNSKPRFTAHVMAKVRPGDVGFTKEAVDTVYDQIIHSLHLDPETFSYISRCKVQTEGLRKEFWNLHNSKVYPQNELDQMYKYLDDTADMMDNKMFEVPAAPVKAAPEITWSSGFPEEAKARVIKLLDDLPPGARTEVKHIDINKSLIKENIEGQHMGKGVYEFATPDFSDATFYHELAHAIHVKNPAILDDYAKAMGKLYQEMKHDALVESFADRFQAWLRVPKLQSKASQQFFTSRFPKAPKVPAAAPAKVLKPEYANFQNIRQAAMDKAHKWYYKEYPDYTNTNAFDAMMKTIFPYWTYESQRWPWLARTMIRHPGTFMAFERWQDNTDYGYIHIPGTSIDVNPFRGTVAGTITTRLTRRDFPEYYDAYPPAGNFVEFMDYISRFGFYPGAHISIPMSAFGGMESQLGETVPPIMKTPLMAAIALFPESESVKFISEHLFGDRFRDYMTMLMVNKRGGDGSLIWTKMKEGVDLTDAEHQMWIDSRQEAALYGVGMEQFGLFRMRTDEQYAIYEKASEAIEEMTGITPDQQKWYRMHGYRIWDVVGGLSYSQQAILQEMDYYRWVGLNTPLLPSRQQSQLRKTELFWDDVKHYSESQLQSKIDLQQDLINGVIGPDAYTDIIRGIYADQRDYIDTLHDTNLYKGVPITLEEKKAMLEEHNIVMPTLHPSKELLNLYFSVELKQKIDEETGEKIWDWDSFWAQREAIEYAVPEEYKAEWDDYIERNTTPLEKIRRQVSDEYFKSYNRVWQKVLESQYDEGEQRLINEWYSLRRRGIKLERQALIKSTVRANGRMLISNFQSDVSEARQALRYANPLLDAWLFYWGRVGSFLTPEASEFYPSICHTTGRKI